MRIRKGSLLLMALAAAFGPECRMLGAQERRTSDRPAAFEIGKPFPTISLPALDGRARSVSDFRGKKLILHIFASW